MARKKIKQKKTRGKKEQAKPAKVIRKKIKHWDTSSKWYIPTALAAVCISIAVSGFLHLFHSEYIYLQWVVIFIMSATASGAIVKRTCNACCLGVGIGVGLVSSVIILLIRILSFNLVQTQQEIFFYLFAGLIFGILGCFIGGFRIWQ